MAAWHDCTPVFSLPSWLLFVRVFLFGFRVVERREAVTPNLVNRLFGCICAVSCPANLNSPNTFMKSFDNNIKPVLLGHTECYYLMEDCWQWPNCGMDQYIDTIDYIASQQYKNIYIYIFIFFRKIKIVIIVLTKLWKWIYLEQNHSMGVLFAGLCIYFDVMSLQISQIENYVNILVWVNVTVQ